MQAIRERETVPVASGPEGDDERLIARIASGDRAALGQLYTTYQHPLFRYLCQLTPDRGLAEEILQDTLVAVWKGAAGFQGRSRVLTWLIGIARRQAHNSLRRHGLPSADSSQLDLIADSAPNPEERALAGADRQSLLAAVNSLAPIHREVLALNFVQGFSYQEIAALLEVPEGTVKSRLSNAKRALRALLDAEHRV
ncbi:MAG: RNA polymerase sigma factor [Dehalococcoidia bacterium]